MANSTVSQTTVAPQKGHDVDAAQGRFAGFLERSYAAGLAAHAGGGQGAALALTKDFNRITTVATAGDSVLLPDAVHGRSIFVKNAHATNSLNVFPKTGENINALSANAAYALAATKGALFVCVVNGTWDTILTA